MSNQKFSKSDAGAQAAWKGFSSQTLYIAHRLLSDDGAYVDCNKAVFQSLIEKRGNGWLCFMPLDLSGIYRPNELMADNMKDWPIIGDKVSLQCAMDEVRNSLTSLMIDYQATDCFLSNCIQPSTWSKSNHENGSFGYALFWLAKRGRKVDMLLDATEAAKCIYTGDLQASADAVRGLSEHPDLSMICQDAVNNLTDRLITEMNIIQFSVNEDEVICKFIPPMENEISRSDQETSSNQYWRIRMLDILKQLYPQKEYIDIELIGVDLLDELGIKPLDYKLRIQKCNRHCAWVTEINGWVKNRIDRSLRPSSWEQYITEIDRIRININELIEETIRFIDDIYRKGHYTKERWKRVEDRLGIFKKQTFSETRLPVSAVDPYCLYSEGSKTIPTSDFFTMSPLLSVEKYTIFRKQFNEVCTSLDNFYRQFTDILLARINRQDLVSIKNPKLAMFNLYSAAKALYQFHLEYDSLFLEYSNLNQSFGKQELENMLTLVNVWCDVLDTPPHGQAIAYKARQRYRNGISMFRELLSKVADITGGELYQTTRHVYIALPCIIDEDNSLNDEYFKLVLTLREVFKSCVQVSSDRWYCEMQSIEFAYIPIILGAYPLTAFKIPFYKLFDTAESQISQTLLPCEIEDEVKEKIFKSVEVTIWMSAMQKIQEIKLYLKRYNQVIQCEPDLDCMCTVDSFITHTTDKIKKLWNEFTTIEELIGHITITADTQTADFINAIRAFISCHNELLTYLADRRDTEDIIQVIDKISAIMFALQPLIARMGDEDRLDLPI